MGSAVKERLTEYLKFKGITKSAFGREVGVSSAYVNSITRTINPDIIKRIRLSYPDLNTDWVLLGEGQMLKPQTANSVSVGSVSGNGNNFVAGNSNRIGVTAESRIEDVEVVETLEAIPLISSDQAKATDLDVKQLVLSGSKEVKRLSIWEFFEKFGEFDAICPTYRDSMIPTYVPGDFLFIKYRHVTNDSYIKQGRYLLDTRDYGVVLCLVEDMEDGTLELSFQNSKKYKPMRLRKEDVLSIADIVLMVRMGDMAFDVVDIGYLQKQLEAKDEQFASLIKQFDKTGDRVNRVIDQNQHLIDALIDKLKKE